MQVNDYFLVKAEKKQPSFMNDFIYIGFECDKNNSINVKTTFAKPYVSKRTTALPEK